MRFVKNGAAAAAVLMLAGIAGAQVRPVTIIAIDNQPLPGSGGDVVSVLNAPFTDGNGKVGFVGTLTTGAGTDVFVYYDNQVVWRNSQALPGSVLTGGESTMGVGNSGQFIYSPTDDGQDSVWTHLGALAVEGDPIPSSALFWSFASRPHMIPDGTAYFVAGERTTAGGTTSNRALYRASFPGPVFTRVIGGGDVVDGFTVSTGASDFTYWVSDNGQHVIREVTTTAVSTANVHIYVNGTFTMLEGSPVPGGLAGENWQNFAAVSINNSGDFVVGGDTSAATAVDGFVAWNGRIKAREGDVVDGFALVTGVNALSINNRGQVAHTWGSGATETLYYGYGPLLRSRSRVLLRQGDTVDVNNDTVGDYTVADLEASGTIGPGIDLSNQPNVYLEVELTPVGGGTTVEAIIRIDLPAGLRCPFDWDMNGSLQPADIALFVSDWAADVTGGTQQSDIDGNDVVTPADVATMVSGWFNALAIGC